jgi:hypothetical protein
MNNFRMKIYFLLTIVLAATASAATPAERRLQAATDLRTTFASSVVRGLDLDFTVRGSSCDVLQVEGYVNLTEGMMLALSNGTLIYGQVLPGGVSQYALGRGFRGVGYTNTEDRVYLFAGSPTLTRGQLKKLRRCTQADARKLNTAETPHTPPSPPPFENLSWQNARAGTKLYNGAYRHEATILRLDPAHDRMQVRYVRTGEVEPKQFSAVARYWYVRKK